MRKISLPLFAFAFLIIITQAPILWSDDTDELGFSHQIHVTDQEIACLDCHEGAADSETGSDNLMPEKSVCMDCHESDEIAGFENIAPITDYSQKFSHKLHLDNDVKCENCHVNIAQKETSLPKALPVMNDCQSCHENKMVASENCMTCHMENENLKPVSHTLDFLHNHALLARADAKEMSANMNCASCHTTQYCQDCHEGENLDRTTHPLNYEFTHALDAINKQNNCTTCHTDRQFCNDCHRDNNVLPHTHTAGWVNNFPNDGGRHAVEGRNDLEACASCHENNAQITCQPCHAK
ncbi:MAG: hypothetical protein H6627_06770 [Calditrichae bacterium]|nr:hypothetical protein [Calditrichia bacterium]